jgi:hypothetical protein
MPTSDHHSDSHYAIARIDLPDAGTHGWQVRMQRQGVKYGKFFADRLHQGAKPALIAAQNWRDALLDELSNQTQARICETSRRNRSGVVGVSKITVVSSNGTVYQFWQATWSPTPGQRRCVKFSIKRHGDRTAFQLAVEARTKGINSKG